MSKGSGSRDKRRRIGWWVWLQVKLLRWVLRFRYKVSVHGLENVDLDKPTLFLPNHPSFIDPLVLYSIIYPKFAPKPVVSEVAYYHPWAGFLIKQLKGWVSPSARAGSLWQDRYFKNMLQKIRGALYQKDNVVIYPAGRTKDQCEELLRANSLVYDLVSTTPGVQIVLVRTLGFWGSRFSKALGSEDFKESISFLRRIGGLLLKNFFFFIPKRKVSVSFEVLTEVHGVPLNEGKIAFNRALEAWYNKVPDSLLRVRECFWQRKLPPLKEKDDQQKRGQQLVPPEVAKIVLEKISQLSGRPIEQISPSALLSRDLGLDSLYIAQLVVHLDKNFHSKVDVYQLESVQDVLNLASLASSLGERQRKVFQDTAPKWNPKERRLGLQFPMESETLLEALLQQACRQGKRQMVCDRASGMWSYRKFKKAIVVLAEKIKYYPGEHVGVLMPSSVAAYVLTAAIWLSGKTPVMLNWTMGERSLEHSVALTRIRVVFSSWNFVNQLSGVDFGFVSDRLVFLEDLRLEVGVKGLLRGFFMQYMPSKTILKQFRFDQTGNDCAVVLFTSGTESLPKGVPLSHKNILSNQRALFSAFALKEDSVFFSFLPPFHSFGFSLTGFFPLLVGARSVFSPDPNDVFMLNSEIQFWQPTLIAGPPGFIGALLESMGPGEWASIQLVVTGAESAPKTFVDKVYNLLPGVQFMEGYGISECSPVISFTRQGELPVGVGKLLPGVDILVLNPDTLSAAAPGEEGEFCFAGESVFSGYFGYAKDPFVEVGGRRWYRSGDRGHVDTQGNLILQGRFSRFVKIYGEMISLGGIEEDLLIWFEQKHLPSPERGPPLVVTAKRSKDDAHRPELIVWALQELSVTEMNSFLHAQGVGSLSRINALRVVSEIPLSGTGKVLYRKLEMGE